MKAWLQVTLKRLMDVTVSAVALGLLSPVFLVIALLVKLDSKGPVFFRQERVGRNGQKFRIVKFRTMRKGSESRGDGVYVDRNDPRITQVGRWLRRFSVDELPQLAQVLTGEMSLVGPRPALPYQLEYYSVQDRKRLLMRPGLTGWSQVNGRNCIGWPARLQRDVWYVENFSLAVDLKILLRTPLVLLSGEGLYGARENFFLSGRDDIPVPTGRME